MQFLLTVHKNPFGRLLIFYMAGIITAAAFHVTNTHHLVFVLWIIVALLMLLLFAESRHPGYNTGWRTGIYTGLILAIAGFINMSIHNQSVYILSEASNIQGVSMLEIYEPAVITEKTVKSTAQIRYLRGNNSWIKCRQKILIYLEKDSCSMALEPGEYILANLSTKQIPEPSNPLEFNYSRYLSARGIHAQAYLKTGYWRKTDFTCHRSLKAIAFSMQKRLLLTYKEIGLNNTLYSLLSALTLGYKSDLEARTRQIFSQAGVMHVMALSGYNVAVIALAMGYLLFFADRFRSGRILKTLIIIILIWLFAFVTGLSPSVTRAAAMITLVLTGKLIQRRVNTTNILFVSAFALLTISPALVSDISFQLSFAAVWGIITFQPVLSRIFRPKSAILNWIWQLFTVSCAAQFATLPLTLYHFHQFPVYFWLTNLYVVPLVSVIICTAGIFLLFSFCHPLMLLTGKILALLLDLLYKTVAFTELLPCSVIENIHINMLQTMLLYMMILAFSLFLLQRRVYLIWIITGFVIIFQLMNMMRIVAWNEQQLFMVGNNRGATSINMITGRNCMLLADSLYGTDDPKIRYLYGNFWISHGVADHITETDMTKPFGHSAAWLGNNILFNFAGKRIVILKEPITTARVMMSPLSVDWLIVTGKAKPDLGKVAEWFKPDLLILDSSVRNYQADKWLAECAGQGIACWIVSRQGAFVWEGRLP